MSNPRAECKYHHLCSLYNNGVLPLEIEKEMCGSGLEIEDVYEPEIPTSIEFIPIEGYQFGSGGVCEAFAGI